MSLHTRSQTHISLANNFHYLTMPQSYSRGLVGQIKGKAIEDPSHFQDFTSLSWWKTQIFSLRPG